MNEIKMLRNAAAIVVVFAVVLPVLGQNPKSKAKSRTNPVAVIETSMGAIKVELFAAQAPVTVKNFLDYANSGFYSGTIVHRVDFVACFGGYTEALMGRQPLRKPIKNESKNGLKNKRGMLAMARYDDPDSATSQFYINLKDNSNLDAAGGKFGYAAFGKVIEGMNVVDKIAGVKTANQGNFYNFPLQTIVVKSVRVQQ